VSGGGVAVNGGLTVYTGGAYVTVGGLTVLAGGATVAGGITADSGGLVVSVGGLTVAAGGATMTGGLTVDTLTQTSDLRLKRITGAVVNALEDIARLRGVYFSWRGDPREATDSAQTHLGFIAQEVQSVMPFLVSETADGYQGIAYTEMVPLLVEGIKELRQELKAHAVRIRALEQEIARLRR
jgi:hypothetical protein